MLWGLMGPALAAAPEAQLSAPPPPLTVALKPAPPFVIHQGDKWSGLAVDLWQDLSKTLGRPFVFKPYQTIDEVLSAVENGQADLAIGAISVTPEREAVMDFTQPYFQGGTGIATVKKSSSLMASLMAILNWDLLRALAALTAVLFVFGLLIWFFERKKNPEQFGGGSLNGIGQGFWWSAVTMTTVGYGDKAPISFWGRAVALIWMFASVITISGFTAAIASSITLSHLEARIHGLADLNEARVGTVTRSASSLYLNELSIAHHDYPTVEAALDDLETGELDAVVHDLPIMRYLISRRENRNLLVLPEHLHSEHYAFLLPQGSDLREALNQALLREMDRSDWKLMQAAYFD